MIGRITLVALLVFGCLARPGLAQTTPSDGAGYVAGITCSAVFLAGRNPLDVLREELGWPEAWASKVADPVVDYDRRIVTVAYEGAEVPRLAVFRERLGTVLMPPGTRPEELDGRPFDEIEIPWPEGDPAEIPWPDGDLIPSAPWPREVDRARLELALEAAFADDKYSPHETLAVVVVYDGRLLAERYASGWSDSTQYRSWSSAKSVASALIGVLVGEGLMDVKEPPQIPEWRADGDPRQKITVENLLHMSSGLESTGSNTPEGYWGGIDTAKHITTFGLETEPGTRWKYSNYDTLLLVRAAKEVLGDFESYLTFPRRALLNKIGMRHTFPEVDAHGNFILSSQMYTTARDLARLGLLYVNDGVWNGERILPEGWVEYTMKPAPARKPDSTRDWGYGAQFWLLGHDPRVPEDTFTSAGHRGQHATIVPSRRLVVSRTGLDPRRGSGWDQVELVADVLAAIDSSE